jgi:hypothetical protein
VLLLCYVSKLASHYLDTKFQVSQVIVSTTAIELLPWYIMPIPVFKLPPLLLRERFNLLVFSYHYLLHMLVLCHKL